jgi:hypothetical protein
MPPDRAGVIVVDTVAMAFLPREFLGFCRRTRDALVPSGVADPMRNRIVKFW